MPRDESYESELTAGREEIAAVLSGVADGIRTGTVRVTAEAGAVTVDTPEELTLEVELEVEDDEVSLELELEWPAPSDTAAGSPIDVAPEDGTESQDESEETTLVEAAGGTRSLARFEVYRARDEEWRWRLRHRNGNIIATSGEGYTRKHNAVKGLRSVVENAPGASVTEEFTN